MFAIFVGASACKAQTSPPGSQLCAVQFSSCGCNYYCGPPAEADCARACSPDEITQFPEGTTCEIVDGECQLVESAPAPD